MTDMRTETFSEEEFWREVASNGTTTVDEDEGRGNVTDEGETEADWLNEVGFGEMSQQWRQGKSLPESDLGNAVLKLSLRPHQADAVRKRIRTLNATLKKRRKNQRRPPDVRSFFQEPSENKDSSRSATPDSLDSGEFVDSSPPRRPSTPNYMENFINRSTDAGVPSFVSVFDNQPLSITSSQSPRSNNIFRHAIRFPIKGSATDEGEIASDDITGIEMINYHNVGTIYMKGYLHSRKPIPAPIPTPLTPQNNHSNNIDLNTRTYNVSSTNIGFAEELAKQQQHLQNGCMLEEETFTENSFVDPSGLTRLSDLSEDDVKNLRRILLMELTAQCDHLNIQIRRRKIPKGVKKPSFGEEPPTGVFGLSLETLLNKDRKVTGEPTLQVPIAFEKLLNFLWKRALNDEGLLRLGGNKAKINDLKTVFESSLYSEPEQVDAAMSQCSSHDVANLLKQFIRELPVPLLGYEYIDTFFDIAADLKDRSQESCLRLLVLLLPQSHQAVLSLLLDFIRDLVKNCEVNKMGLCNVAMILAPNLVPSSALNIRSQTKELNRAATWVCLTQSLIRTGPALFVVPSDLLSQMRQCNDLLRQKKLKGMRKTVSAQNSSSLTVSAPQLGFPEYCIPVHAGTTAGDIVSYLLEEAERNLEEKGTAVTSPVGAGNRRRGGGRGDIVKAPQGPNLSCLLAQVNKDITLKSHALFEVGGNVGYRRVDPSALIPAIIRDNPSAAWVLRCSHRHSQPFQTN